MAIVMCSLLGCSKGESDSQPSPPGDASSLDAQQNTDATVGLDVEETDADGGTGDAGSAIVEGPLGAPASCDNVCQAVGLACDPDYKWFGIESGGARWEFEGWIVFRPCAAAPPVSEVSCVNGRPS